MQSKISKLNVDIFGNYIFENFNYFLEKGEFHCIFKHAYHLFYTNDKTNNRIVSIFLNLSKTHKKIMHQQQLRVHFHSVPK